MKRTYLLTPGPSEVPYFIREILSRAALHHRTPQFRRVLEEVNENLKYLFATEEPVIIFSSSGSGAMEAAVANFFSKQDKVIVICGGKFGERWKEISENFSLKVIPYEVSWGDAPQIEKLKELLKNNPQTKGILTTLCETSTATVFDIKEMAKLTKDSDILFIVDAISGLGQDRLLMDNWGIDIVVSGSQKGLMLPPGAGFLALSKKAKEILDKKTPQTYYFNLKKYLKSYLNNDTPFTPPTYLILALKEGLQFIKKEGREKRWQYFEKLAEGTRRAGRKIGLSLFSKSPSASLTAFRVPSEISATTIVKKLREEEGVSIAAGQGKIKDDIIRIAHMGWINEQDLIMCFSLLEKVLLNLGHNFKLGASVEALQNFFYGSKQNN